MNHLKEFQKALIEGMGYDYIANNYWDMSLSDLKRITLEALYQITDEQKESMAEELTYYINEE